MIDLTNEIKLGKSNRYHIRVAVWQKRNNRIMPKKLKRKLYEGTYKVELNKNDLKNL